MEHRSLPLAMLLFVVTAIFADLISMAHGGGLTDVLPLDGLVKESELDGEPTTEVNVVGKVVCFTPPWKPKSEPLFAGIDVIYSCDGGRTTVGQILVDKLDGTLRLLLNNVKFIVTGDSPVGPCRPVLRTPIIGCAIHEPTVAELKDLIGHQQNGHDDHTQYGGEESQTHNNYP